MLPSALLKTHLDTLLQAWIAVHERRPRRGTRHEGDLMGKGRLILDEIAQHLEHLEREADPLAQKGSQARSVATPFVAPCFPPGQGTEPCLTIQWSPEDGRALRAALQRLGQQLPGIAGLLEGEGGKRLEKAIETAHPDRNPKWFLSSVAGEEDPGAAVDSLA